MGEDWNTNLHTILNVVDTHRCQMPDTRCGWTDSMKHFGNVVLIQRCSTKEFSKQEDTNMKHI